MTSLHKFIHILFTAAFAAGITVAVSSCSHSGHSDEHADHEHLHEAAEEPEHDHDHDHEGHHAEEEADEHGHSHDEASPLLGVQIHDHEAELLGIKAEKIEAGSFTPALSVGADISSSTSESSLVVAPTTGTLVIPETVAVGSRLASGATVATIDPSKVTGSDIESSNAATLRSTSEEYERMQRLFEKRLVTASQLNQAREAYEVARAMSGSKAGATRRATAPLAGVVTALLAQNGAFVQAGEPIAQIARTTRLTMKANVPDRYSAFIPQVTGARIEIPGREGLIDVSASNPSGLSAAPVSNGGYIPVSMSFDNPGIASGSTAARAYLLGTPRHGVISVPRKALIEDQGSYFVYRVTGPEHYRKTPVTIGATDGSRVEITSGIAAGDSVVIAGAPMVRMAQNQAAPVHGHTHNH